MVGSNTTSKNFVRLLDEIIYYPYNKEFKVSDVCSFWNELSEEEQSVLLRQFAAYCRKTNLFTFSTDDIDFEKNGLNFTYKPVFNNSFAVSMANLVLCLYKVESGKEFIIPTIIRELDGEVPFYYSNDLEDCLTSEVREGKIPFLEIVGEFHSFTVYKRL